jgi:hypothetical protein
MESFAPTEERIIEKRSPSTPEQAGKKKAHPNKLELAK